MSVQTCLNAFIRTLGCLLGVLIACSGGLDLIHEPPDPMAEVWLTIPCLSSLPSWACAAVFLAPMHGLSRDRREFLSSAYVVLVLFTASYALLCVADTWGLHARPLAKLPVAAFFMASANALLLRHANQHPDDDAPSMRTR